MIIVSCSGTRTTPAEVIEARYPLVVERCELAADSGGAGRFRGGCGCDIEYRILEDMYLMSTVERTRLQPWGLSGGGDGRANKLRVEYPDGREVSLGRRRVSVSRQGLGCVSRPEEGEAMGLPGSARWMRSSRTSEAAT